MRIVTSVTPASFAGFTLDSTLVDENAGDLRHSARKIVDIKNLEGHYGDSIRLMTLAIYDVIDAVDLVGLLHFRNPLDIFESFTLCVRRVDVVDIFRGG